MKSAPPRARLPIFPRYRIRFVPRMLRSAPPLRRGAPLIRGPSQRIVGPGSAARRQEALRCVRDTTTLRLEALQQKSPARWGDRARPLSGRRCGCPDNSFRQDCTLLDHLNDAARTRFDQHGPAVHHGVAIGCDAEGLRHVVVRDAGFRQHAAHDHAIWNSVIWHALAHDVFTERRALVDSDGVDIVVDDYAAAAHGARGDLGLRLRRDRCTDGARDRCNGKYLVPHDQLPCDDARRLAPARNPTQFIARGIVPKTMRFHPLQFSASFACAGTHCSDKRLLSWNFAWG